MSFDSCQPWPEIVNLEAFKVSIMGGKKLALATLVRNITNKDCFTQHDLDTIWFLSNK